MTLILISVLVVLVIGMIFLFRMLFNPSPNSALTNLSSLKDSSAPDRKLEDGEKLRKGITLEDVQLKLNESKGRSINPEDPEVKFFRAGYFSTVERDRFQRIEKSIKYISPLVLGPIGFVADSLVTGCAAAAMGFLLGRVAPDHILKKRIKTREEDALYFLPLVIEQISIGVSSSLDIGPCVAYVVSMADERSSHNVITELLAQVMKLMKAGMSLDEALTDVGEVAGIKEVKNSFMFLAQCAKHGGEISKQLQDLAESVTLSRQLEIEARIVALPNKAAGALAMIFFGFFVMLLAGLIVQISGGLSGMN